LLQRYEKEIIQTNNLPKNKKIQGNNLAEIEKIQRKKLRLCNYLLAEMHRN